MRLPYLQILIIDSSSVMHHKLHTDLDMAQLCQVKMLRGQHILVRFLSIYWIII